MADEPRRSGRATKGQHTRKDSPEPPPPPPPVKQVKTKTKKKAKDDDDDDEDEKDEVIRCVCGTEAEMAYVCCDKCDAWQHIECMGLDPDLNWERKKYYCEQCAPQNHKELLAKIERGERPWEKLFEADKKKKGKKGAAGTTKKTRKSEGQSDKAEDSAAPESSQPEQEQPAPTQESEVRNGAEEETKANVKQVETPTQGKRKRQSSARESVGHDEKRRKSVAPEEAAGEIPSDPTSLPSDRQKLVEALSKLINPLVRKQVKEGKHRVPDNYTEASYCTRIALEIDNALAKNQGPLDGKDSPYFKQFTAIQFNIKKNPALFDGVLSGAISKDQLAKMSSEEMAPEERQRENAAMREAAEKQAVLVHEDGPRMRKTHKGDEVIEDDAPNQIEETSYGVPVGRAPAKADLGSPTTDTAQTNGSDQPLKVDTSSPQSASRPSAGGFNITQVWSSVGSPDQEHQRRTSEVLRRQSSVTVPPSAGPGDDADVDRLLKDEDETYSPADYSSDPTVAWHGVLRMPAVADFTTVGRHVAGGDIGQIIPWNQLMSRDPEIRGRIDIKRATEYITSLRGSGTDSTNIGVLSLTPVDDKNREEMGKICTYFLQRDRWGVVSEVDRKHNAVRDIYVVPIQAGAMHLPEFIEMLEYCTIEQPPTQDMLLLTVIARTVSPHPSAEATPAQAPSATPTHPSAVVGIPPQSTPHTVPQFSPVVPQGPGHFASPFSPPPQQVSHPATPANSQAAAVLGPHINCPVAQQLLATNPSVEILANLRSILDEVPEARTDMMVLTNHLKSRNEAAQPAH